MPFEPGNTYGKGRRKGSKNKASTAMQEMMDEHYPEWDPVLAMAEIAQDDEIELPVRVQCMKSVAEYLHPKQRSVELSMDEPKGTVSFTWGKPHPSALCASCNADKAEG